MQITERNLSIAEGHDRRAREEEEEESRTARLLEVPEPDRIVRCIRAMFVTLPGGFGPLCSYCAEEPPFARMRSQRHHIIHRLVAYGPQFNGLAEQYACLNCRRTTARARLARNCYACNEAAGSNPGLPWLYRQSDIATIETERPSILTHELREEEDGTIYYDQTYFEC